MNIWYIITVVSGFSSIVPAIAGWRRWRKIRSLFHPFIIILWANFIAELVSFLSVHFHGFNAAWYNIYAFIAYPFIAWQLLLWSPCKNFSRLLFFSTGFLLLLWLFEWHSTGSLGKVFTLFLVMRDACISSFCFYLLYRRIPALSAGVFKDAIVLICSGWLILSAYEGITELLIFCGEWLQTPELPYVEPLFSFINFFVIVIHLIAVIWIPPKPPSSLPQPQY
ncbi:MAG: hypothetical protein J7539_17535 [Niabella sp.]|nr:hypothetical protein [Niabella sp.]